MSRTRTTTLQAALAAFLGILTACGGDGGPSGAGPGPTLAWSPLAPSGTAPSPRWGHSAVLDPAGQAMIVFGGTDSADAPVVNPTNDVWILDLAVTPPAWTPLSPTGAAPAPRHGHSAVWDAPNHRMIVFGGRRPLGSGTQTLFNDVWQLDFSVAPPAWSPIAPAGAPPSPRFGQSGFLDDLNQRLVLFGGANGLGSPVFNDVWTLNLSGGPATWTLVASTGGPPTQRYLAASMFDGVTQLLTVFGGFTSAGLANDVWTLNLSLPTPTWNQPSIAGAPPSARYGTYAVLDSARQQMVLFGGGIAPGGPTVDEVWLFGASGWTRPTLSGAAGPSARYVGTSILDAAHHRMLIFGGTSAPFNPAASLNEVWELGL